MKVEISNNSTSFTHLAELLHDNVSSLILNHVKIAGDNPALYDFWRVLRGHPNLAEFSWSNVTFEDLEADVSRLVSVLFVACPKLTRVVLDNMHVSVGAIQSAEYCTHLREVTLSNGHYSDEEAAGIAQALSRSSHLEKVDFRGNDLTEQGLQAFPACLSLNKTIQNLTLTDGGETRAKSDKFRRQNSASAA